MFVLAQGVVAKDFDDAAVARAPLAVGRHHPPQFSSQRRQASDLRLHVSELFGGQGVRLLARPVWVVRQSQQSANRLDGEAELAGVPDEG